LLSLSLSLRHSLSQLLSKDMQRHHSVVLQCVRFLVATECLERVDKWQESEPSRSPSPALVIPGDGSSESD